MADMLINPNRYRANIQREQQREARLQLPSLWQEPNKGRSPHSGSILDLLVSQPKEKKPSYEEIENVIFKLRSKLRSGGRLTPQERAYLAKYAQGELNKLNRAEQERESFKARLQGCKTKEEAHQAFLSASMQADAADPHDPDLSSVIVGQLTAALREAGPTLTDADLERQLPEQAPSRRAFSRRA